MVKLPLYAKMMLGSVRKRAKENAKFHKSTIVDELEVCDIVDVYELLEAFLMISGFNSCGEIRIHI